jgi:hypothetical protein
VTEDLASVSWHSGSQSSIRCLFEVFISASVYTAQISLIMLMGNVVQACATWLVHHPYLLGDKECLAPVVEVVDMM